MSTTALAGLTALLAVTILSTLPMAVMTTGLTLSHCKTKVTSSTMRGRGSQLACPMSPRPMDDSSSISTMWCSKGLSATKFTRPALTLSLSILTVWMGESLSPQNNLALIFLMLSFLTLTIKLTSMLVLGLRAIMSMPMISPAWIVTG